MPHIDDFPTLWGCLGKTRTDKIRDFQTNKMAVGGPRTRWVANPHQEALSQLPSMYYNAAVDDVITGIAALDQGSDRNLSAPRLFGLLTRNKRISTELIMVVMKLEDRQARKYMAAAKLVIFHLTRCGFGDGMEVDQLIDNGWLERPLNEHEYDYSACTH